MISIIIPAFNEANYIKNTILTLKRVVGSVFSIEIIAVDNGSTDSTLSVLRGFKDVKVISLEKSVTVAEARNVGADAATGQVLAFIDADIIVTPEWWRELTKFNDVVSLNPTLKVITGCKVSISMCPTWIEMDWFQSLKAGQSNYINSGNLVCTRAAFNSLGGFDIRLRTGEDVDFCTRAKALSIDVVSNAAFHVHHEGYPKNLLQFFKREKWHGTGDLQSLSKFLRSKVAIISFLVTAISLCAVISFCTGGYLLGLILSVVLIATNSSLVLWRLRIKSPLQFCRSFILNYLYLLARSSSILNLIRRRNRSR